MGCEVRSDGVRSQSPEKGAPSPQPSMGERENHSPRSLQFNSASIQIAAGLETLGPRGFWVKTRKDRGFSFRLDTKVVSKYPVKA